VGTAGALVTLASSTPKKGTPSAAAKGAFARADLSAYDPPPALSPLHLGKGALHARSKPGTPVLPSHISIFGEAEEAAAVLHGASSGAAAPALKLPSHISAFGAAGQDELLYAARALVGGGPPPPAALDAAFQNPCARRPTCLLRALLW
jgi:hypothetical protein